MIKILGEEFKGTRNFIVNDDNISEYCSVKEDILTDLVASHKSKLVVYRGGTGWYPERLRW